MKISKRNHFFVMLLMMLIGISFVQYMMTKADLEKRNRIAVVLPEDHNGDCSRVMDGVRDYAMNHNVLLDVWYKESASAEELETLIADEENNDVMGVIMVYPERYMGMDEKEIYDFENVLVITDLMKEYFPYTAVFEECDETAFSLPVPVEVIGHLMRDDDDYVYIKNTYKLGYCSAEMIEQYAQSGKMDNICLEYIRADKTVIANGDINSLLTK